VRSDSCDVDGILEATRKTKNINIRINELDLANLRKSAECCRGELGVGVEIGIVF
jgi:hypothetical protein